MSRPWFTASRTQPTATGARERIFARIARAVGEQLRGFDDAVHEADAERLVRA